MQTTAQVFQPGVRHGQGHTPTRLPITQAIPPTVTSRLSVRALRTEESRVAIADLRKLAAFGVEKDLELELAPLEKLRDAIGLVTAIYLDGRVVATVRFVPTGYGMTAAERLQKTLAVATHNFGRHSWEVGRIVMAPEDRNPALLPHCLGMALAELLKWEDPVLFHASTTLQMARLWRRFGMKTAATMRGASGQRYALVEGQVRKVAEFLQMPRPFTEENAVFREAAPARWALPGGSSGLWWSHEPSSTKDRMRSILS